MPPRPHRLHITCIFITLACAACSTGSEHDVKVGESPQGIVALQQVPDRSFQAAHPIKIDSSTIALVLNGILIRDNLSVQKPSSESTNLRRVFSGSEVGYLAPLISDGLRSAASDQLVKFRVGQTAGVLYAYGRSLYVTLTHYRSGSDTAGSKPSDATGFGDRILSFMPETAKRPDSYLDARSKEATLVIDYELLAMLPPASVPSASTPTAPPSAPPANVEQPDAPKKDSEIEALRKELQDIKKQLAEQEAERARSQPKNGASHK